MEELYSARAVAQMLGLNERTILRWLRSGKIRGKKLGKQWWISRSDLNEFSRTAGE